MGLSNAVLTPAQRAAGASAVAGLTPSGALIDAAAANIEGKFLFNATMRAFRSRQWVDQMIDDYVREYEARRWVPGEAIKVGMARLPSAWYKWDDTTGNIKIHRCVVAGTTGPTEPTWATADYHVTPGSADTIDGSVTWRAYNITHLAAQALGTLGGTGTQADPYSDPRCLTTASAFVRATHPLAPGRAVAFKAGGTFASWNNDGGALARIYVMRPVDDAAVWRTPNLPAGTTYTGTSTTGGTVPAGTYYAVLGGIDSATGQTVAVSAVSAGIVTTGSTSTVTWQTMAHLDNATNPTARSVAGLSTCRLYFATSAAALTAGTSATYVDFPAGSTSFTITSLTPTGTQVIPSINWSQTFERRTFMRWGVGANPIIDGGAAGAFRFGIRQAYSTLARNEGRVTYQDIDVTAIGGCVGTSEAAGIFITVDPNNQSLYSTIDTGTRVIRCRVENFKPLLTGTSASTPDVNGIKLLGANNAVIDCELDGTWDDGYWFVGANHKNMRCRAVNCGSAVESYPTRERGDCIQANSTLGAGNGDTRADNTWILAGTFDHSNHFNKHALICNPDMTGTNNRCTGYWIAYNIVKGYIGTAGVGNIPVYLSNFEGDFHDNLIIGGHQTRPTDSMVTCFAKVRMYNNFIIAYGAMRGIEFGTITIGTPSAPVNPGQQSNYTATASGAQCWNNTIVYVDNTAIAGSSQPQRGIIGYGTGNGVPVINNLIIGPGANVPGFIGAQLGTGSTAGGNAFWNCAGGNYQVGAGYTALGSDVTTDPLAFMGVPYSASSPLKNAGLAALYGTQHSFSGVRRNTGRPTIGAVETPII